MRNGIPESHRIVGVQRPFPDVQQSNEYTRKVDHSKFSNREKIKVLFSYSQQVQPASL